MINSLYKWLKIPGDLNLPSNKKFGFFFSFVFFLFSLYFYYKNLIIYSLIFFISLIILFLITLISPNKLLNLNKTWMLIGLLIGKIINPIVLGIIFFVIFSPIGYFRTKFGSDELNLKKNKESYWILKKNKFKIDFTKQF